MEDGMQEIANFQSHFKDSRLLLACKSCFSSNPPVIVELENSSSCSWCSKEEDDLLLLETKLSKNDDHDVEYFVIRKRQSFFNSNSIQECEKNFGLNWKLCPDGDDCNNAHSEVEFRIWKLESKLKTERRSLIEKLDSSIASNYVHLKGVFHCIVCSKNFSTGKDFSDHCDLDSHKYMMRTQKSKGMLTWKYRPLRDGEKFALCSFINSQEACPDKDHCRNAHSEEELNEWKYRLQLQEKKFRFAIDRGLMSFTDQVLHEYDGSSSPTAVMMDSIPCVEVTISSNQHKKIPTKNFTWTLKIRCADSKEKLNHAAFISRHHKHLFQICRCRKKRKSKFVDHLDFKVMLNDDHSLNLHDGEATYMVKFKTDEYGFFSSSLILEFRNKPRPVLKIDFSMEVIEASFCDLLKQADIPCEPQTLSWERDRTIIRLEKPFANEFEKFLYGLMTKYKPPDTAWDFPHRQSSQLNVFDPNKMSAKNYVEEMHQFLYREEKARSDKLCGVRPFVIALSEDYMSVKGGLCFSVVGCLFAIFELPRHLSRDAEDGLLIFDNCNKVLIGRKNEPLEPVYEVSINEKFTDHVVLQLSENCVKDWKLKSGQTVDVEIQFQLDRERFCRCHCALDMLQEYKLLNLVCPDVKSRKQSKTPPLLNDACLDLDEEQRKVFTFLMSKPKRFQKSPLFVVQGSFGTGKTYTISKCINYLVKTDENARVLICTHSNSAAAIYIDNNFQDHNQWKDKVIRVVYHGRNPATLTQFERHYCLEENNQFRYPTAQDVASHKIFVTTFETALELGVHGTGLIGAFTHIFLDEVAQIMEAAAIIPLTLANSKTKVVIAGDHIQITEKIYSKANHIDDSQFTLLERMYLLYSKQSFHQLVVFRNNYRSIAPILNLIELLFYRKGLLRPCSEITPPRGLTPIQFYDVEGLCEKNVLSGGYYNTAEAQKVTDVVSSLRKSHPEVQQEDIAVVAAYNEQVRLIRAFLRKKDLSKVIVDPVRNIQGREFKIVVLSCVHKRETRENKEGETFGLLSDRNLLNTAFTRTKFAIIAVGHTLTLWSLGKCQTMWREFIKESDRRKGLFSSFGSVDEIKRKVFLNNFSSLNPLAAEFAFRHKKGQTFEKPLQENNVEPHEEEMPRDFDDSSDEDDTLPMNDKMLDDIVKNLIGIKRKNIAIGVDSSGKEFPIEESEDYNEGKFQDGKKMVYNDYTPDHLRSLVLSQPDEFKQCKIVSKNWHSATAVVMDKDSDIKQIFINSQINLGRSFDGDEAVVRILRKVEDPKSQDEPKKLIIYGKVIGITDRYKIMSEKKIVCVPDQHHAEFMCPVDKKIPRFLIEGRKGIRSDNHKIPISKLTKKGDIKRLYSVNYDQHAVTLNKSKHFVVRFVDWPATSKYPIGYVSEEIKPKDFEKYYSIVHDVPPSELPSDVEEESKKLVSRPIDDQGRKDFTDLFVFTIDPEGSTNLDDALSLNRCPYHDDCWKIGIHIADVASVVPADSEIDSEARKRSTSFYSQNYNDNRRRRVVHMLPSSLSSNKCSLLANEKRLAISIFLHSSRLPTICGNQKRVKNIPKPILSYVKSRVQMTYLEAETLLRKVRRDGLDEQRVISGSNADNIGDQLHIIWQTMLKLRFKRIEFSSFYAQPGFDGFLQFCDEASAHMLIEEAMITCNACCIHYLSRKAREYLLRTQDPPPADKCSKWKEENSKSIQLSLFQQATLKNALGSSALEQLESKPLNQCAVPIIPYVWIKIREALNSGDLDTAMVLFSSDDVQPAVSSGQGRFFAIQERAEMQTSREVFSSRNPGVITHFSLRLPLYSQFTSPIRRYCDLQSQRLIIEVLSGKEMNRDSNVLQISTHRNVSLKDLAKKISQRKYDAKKYGEDIQNFSYALHLSKEQNYEIACVKKKEERGVNVSFLDLCKLPKQSQFLSFNLMKLSSQDDESLTWRIKYYDVNQSSRAKQDILSHANLTGTEVSSIAWKELLQSIKSSISSSDLLESPELSRNRIQKAFEEVLKTQTSTSLCSHSPGFGPCIHEDCSKSNKCRDHLDGFSRLKISHYRKITMPLVLGTPLLVQMHCGVRLGICTPSIQLLSVGEDLDICLAHNSSPIETFAAEVRPISEYRFTSLESYVDFWLPLSRMEGIYNSVQDNSNCFILQNVTVTFDQKDEKVFGSFLLHHRFCQKRLMDIPRDDFLCIRVKCWENSSSSRNVGDKNLMPHKTASTWVVHAVVTKCSDDLKDKSSMKIEFSSCTPLAGEVKIPKFVMAKKMKVQAAVEIIQLGVSHRAMTNALRNVQNQKEQSSPHSNEDIVVDLCLDQPGTMIYDSVFDDIVQSVGSTIVEGMKFQLNQGQIAQIRNALRQTISMIQGPPGTGKSFVGAHLAYYFNQYNQLLKNQSKKILYCGPSNRSVDVVAEYLLDSEMKVLRVYGKTFEEEDFPNPLKPKSSQQKTEKRPSQRIAGITLHQIIRKSENEYSGIIKGFDEKFRNQKADVTLKDYENYKNVISKAKLEEFRRHDVIICTCTTAAVMKKTLTTKETKGTANEVYRFLQCIIDECGMCSEPETLVSIIASQANQVVLIGDHQQLQPIIKSKRARDFGLKVSMFERLKKRAGMLTTQYRMDEKICEFPSKHFYDSALLTDKSVYEREKKRTFRFCHPQGSSNTAVLCHVVGEEKTNFSSDRGGESSYYNEDEAKAVIHILMYFIRNGVPLRDIMIITPYSAQEHIIKKLIDEKKPDLKDVHVSTVVTSQGSERDFVILSTVRSRPDSMIEKQASNIYWRRKYIGFVSDPHQINVAITRAKSGLCIVGNSKILEKDSETWKPLIDSYRDRGSLVDLRDPTAPWKPVPKYII